MERITIGLNRLGRSTLAATLAILLLSGTGGCKSGGEARPPKPAATFSEQQLVSLRSTVQTAIQQAGIPGAIIGVWAPDRGTWVEAFGVADAGAKTPLAVTHKVRIGSLTKMFTATAVLQLVDEGRIGLDDSIEKYVRKHKLNILNAKDITIRQLLNHTSGLFSYTDDPALEAVSYANLLLVWSPEELINFAVSHRDYAPPGKEYHYSNTGYALLGLILEDESKEKKSAAEEIDQRIIKRLGLANTSFPRDQTLQEPYAKGYIADADLFTLSMTLRGSKTPGAMTDVTALHPSWPWTAGAMVSDLNDLKVYAKALGTGQLVSKKMQEEQFKTVAIPTGGAARYGLGVLTLAGFIGHRGEVPGYDTCILYSPELDATFVVLLTMDPNRAGADALTLKLIQTVYPDKVKG
ncbi:MAG: serine hydrolase domain-containing protein [Nitrospirota bacterium]